MFSCLNFFYENDAGGFDPHVKHINALIKIDKYVYNLLLNTEIDNLCPELKVNELKSGCVLKNMKNIS